MALLDEQFTETLQAGAPDITYEGNEGKEQQIAQALWDKLPPQVRMQFGSFQQFFSSGAWKKVLEMLQQQMQGREGQEEVQDPILQQEGQAVQEQGMGSQGIGGLMPQPMGMANGGDVRLASHEGNDAFLEQQYEYYLEQGLSPKLAAEKAQKDLEEGNYQDMAYGGIAGDDGRMQYGIGSWFQKKIMDPIKKNIVPIGLGAAGLYGLSQYGGEEGIGGGLSKIGTKIGDFFRSPTWQGQTDDGSKTTGGLKNLLMNPNFLIPAAGLIGGAFAKPDEPGYTGQGAGLNIRDVGRIANITDPQTAMAAGLRFSPDVETRKFTPAEMLASYAETGAEDFSTPAKAYGGRIRAQEGGLMDLGGMEKDYRNDGGFVPLGGEEKADDVPARLSKNEFVFTADAVRNAGGGDMDRGAEVMENVMKNLEGGGKISEESQGKGAQEMFEVSERLSEVV